MNVSATAHMSPPRVTLRLVKPCTLGSSISFAPKATPALNPFAKNAVAEDLMERAYAARTRNAA